MNDQNKPGLETGAIVFWGGIIVFGALAFYGWASGGWERVINAIVLLENVSSSRGLRITEQQFNRLKMQRERERQDDRIWNYFNRLLEKKIYSDSMTDKEIDDFYDLIELYGSSDSR